MMAHGAGPAALIAFLAFVFVSSATPISSLRGSGPARDIQGGAAS